MPKWAKIVSQPNVIIHAPVEGHCRVDKKYDVLKNMSSDIWSKNHKNQVEKLIYKKGLGSKS